jgi:putative heme-binding domain-containing protein
MALAAPSRAGGEEFVVPPGFCVEAAASASESFLALTFDERGTLFASVEGGPILLLLDRDGDGLRETREVFCEELTSCQGLRWFEGRLFATGRRGERAGLWRVTPNAERAGSERIDELAGFDYFGEHGAHGIAVGPDRALYVTIGDHTRLDTTPEMELFDGCEGSLLDVYGDPNGHAIHTSYPYGQIVRLEPESGRWTRFAVGLRNAYDLAWSPGGECFTCDSDMEWDVGLPWYRPVRILQLVRGADFGSRRGSGVFPGWYPDSLPAACEVGRGSPTGVAFGAGASFPARYRDALFVGDWSQGRILAVHFTPRGASESGEAETLVQARDRLNVTDLEVGPEGALYFSSGGRGTAGKVQRLVYGGPPAPEDSGASTPQPPTPETVARRAFENLLGNHAATRAAVGDLLAALDSPDRWLRWSARRSLEQLRDPALAEQLLKTRAERSELEGLLMLARGPLAPGRGDELVARGLLMLRGPFASAGGIELPGPEWTLGVLRALELGLLRHGEPSAQLRERLAAELCERFPSDDARISRELGILMAHLEQPRALAELLDALESEPAREQQIHYALCLHAMPGPWSLADRCRLLAWFERADSWTGGLSFAGYLAAMRARFVANMSDADCLALARQSGAGPHTLALFMKRLGPQVAASLVPELRAAWETADAEEGSGKSLAAKNAALRVLSQIRVDGLAQLLRERMPRERDKLDALWLALAKQQEPQDWSWFAQGLALPSREVREACSRALLEIDKKPDGPMLWRTLLDSARSFGWPRGNETLKVLAHWRSAAEDKEALAADKDDWARALQAWEVWFHASFPEFSTASAQERSPQWTDAQILAFLERSAARAGSPARGAKVFSVATCANCHPVEGQPGSGASGFGPDLTTVAKRFSEPELLESIVHPSRVVSDQYRTLVVTDEDGQHFEGRLVSEDAGALTLLLGEGRLERFARSEIASAEPSQNSFMPEGLLATRTLEEIKDLFAFLHAEAKAPAPADGEEDWAEMFAGKARGNWEGDSKLWQIEGTTLVGACGDMAHSSYLVSKASYADFEVEFDVRLSTSNSGMQYRSSVDASSPDPIGYQADIGQTYWGSLYASDGRGTLVTPSPDLLRQVLDREGWNHFFVRADGDHHWIEVNGAVTVDARYGEHRSGVLAFQLHQGKAMEVRFANARLRRIAPQ